MDVAGQLARMAFDVCNAVEQWIHNRRKYGDFNDLVKRIRVIATFEEERARAKPPSGHRRGALEVLLEGLEEARTFIPPPRGFFSGPYYASTDDRDINFARTKLTTALEIFTAMIGQDQSQQDVSQPPKKIPREDVDGALRAFPKTQDHRGQLLGTGPRAHVYRGQMQGQNWAVKVSSIGAAGRALMKREFDVMKDMKHPNIVGLIGYCAGGSTEEFVLVYEWCNGGSLQQVLHGGRDAAKGPPLVLGMRQRLSVAMDVASALKYLHYQRAPMAIHGNIDSANVLLHVEEGSPSTPKARLAGFGSSHETFSGETLAPTGVGAPAGWAYRDLKQLSRGTQKGDLRRNDVFSFGILLREIVTGVDVKKTAQDMLDAAARQVEYLPEKSGQRLGWGVMGEGEVRAAKMVLAAANKCVKEWDKRASMVEIEDALRNALASLGTPPVCLAAPKLTVPHQHDGLQVSIESGYSVQTPKAGRSLALGRVNRSTCKPEARLSTPPSQVEKFILPGVANAQVPGGTKEAPIPAHYQPYSGDFHGRGA